MITRLKQLLLGGTADNAASNKPEARRLAAAAMMVAVAQADHVLDPREHKALQRALQQVFGLDTAEIDALLELAREEAETATSDHGFTQIVNSDYSAQQKFELICEMWRVAYADGDLHKYEEHLIRKFAVLIYVSHSEFIRAKLLVAAESTASPAPREGP